MKRQKFLSLLLTAVMLLSLMPTNVVFAEEHVHTAECNHEATGEAVEAVQALIDALPTAIEVTADDYDRVQDAFDAYDALTDEEKALITGAEVFEQLFAVFNSQTEPAVNGELQYIDEYGDAQKCSGDYLEFKDDVTILAKFSVSTVYVEGNVTMSGAEGGSPGQVAFEANDTLIILADGACLNITGSLCGNNLTVTTVPEAQNAELVVDGDSFDTAIEISGNLNVYAGTVTVKSPKNRDSFKAVNVNNTLNITNSAKLSVSLRGAASSQTDSAEAYGIYAKTGFNASGSATVEVKPAGNENPIAVESTAKDANFYGIYTSNFSVGDTASVTVKTGKVTAYKMAVSCGIKCNGSFNATRGATVEVKPADGENPIVVESTAGDADVYGIYSTGSISVECTSVTVKTGKTIGANGAENFGIISDADINIDWGTVDVTAGEAESRATAYYGSSYGIYAHGRSAYGGKVAIGSATVTARGGNVSGAECKSVGLYAVKYCTVDNETLVETGVTATVTAIGGNAAATVGKAESYGVLASDRNISKSDQYGKVSFIVASDYTVTATAGTATSASAAYSAGIKAEAQEVDFKRLKATGAKATVTASGEAESYGIWVLNTGSTSTLNLSFAEITAVADKTTDEYADVCVNNGNIVIEKQTKLCGSNSSPVLVKANSINVDDTKGLNDIKLAVGSEFTGDGTESIVTRNSSQTGNNISTLLADGAAFFDGEGGLITANGHFISLEKATVGEHSCSYNVTGNCACGKECAHSTVNPTTGKCTACGADAATVKLTHGTTHDYYSKLADAVAAVQEGDTITVLQPLGDPNDSLNIQIDRTEKPLVGFTVDFGGFSYYKAEITAKNCNLTVKNFAVSYNAFGYDWTAIYASDGGSLTIGDNVSLISTVEMRTALVSSFVPVTVSGNNVTIGFDNDKVDLLSHSSIYAAGNLTVKSGDFYGKVVQFNSASASISGGTFRGGLDLPGTVTGALEKGYAYADITTGDKKAPSSVDKDTAFKVVQCNHKNSEGSYPGKDTCDYCGRSCATDGHYYPTSQYTACVICGEGSCEHENISATGLCNGCNTQFKVKRVIENGTTQQSGTVSKTVWGTSVGEALAEPVLTAATKDIITLYADTEEAAGISWLGNREITICGRAGNHLIRGLTVLGGVETQSMHAESLGDHLEIGDVLAKCGSNGEYTVIYEPGLSKAIDEPVKVIACPHSNNGTTTIGADGKCTMCRDVCSHIDATGASAVGIDGVCSVCGNKLAFKVTRGDLSDYWTDDFADALSKVKDATAFENAVILFTGETDKTARIDILSLILPSGAYKIDLNGRELNVLEAEGSTQSGTITVAEGTSLTLTTTRKNTLTIGDNYYSALVTGGITQTGGTLNLGSVLCEGIVSITDGTTVVNGATFIGPFAMAGGNITIYGAYMSSQGFGMSGSMGKTFKDIIAPGYTLSCGYTPIEYSSWSGLTEYPSAVRVIKCEHYFKSEDTCAWCNTTCNHKTEGGDLNVGEDGKCKKCDYQYYAAKVSEGSAATYYKTLTEAFAVMAAEKTLSLLADCKLTESVSLKAGTYDLGDFSIFASDTVTVPADVSVTLKGKLDEENEIYATFNAKFSIEGTLNIKEARVDEITLGQNGALVAEGGWKIALINATALSGGSVSLKAGGIIQHIQAPETGSVLDFLGDGCAYYVYEGATDEYVLRNAAAATKLIDVKVLAHTCDYNGAGECACGRVCVHTGGFKNSSHACEVCGMHCSHKTAGGESAYNEGVCSICDEACAHPNGFKNNSHACEACGAPCPHNSVNETGFCSDCEMQFKIKVTVKRNNGDIANTAWAESLNEALSFTSSDNYVELKLYRDTASEDTLTLQRCKKVDLNGKTLSSNSAGKILIASGTISFTDSSTGTPGTVSAPIGVYGALSVNANVSFTGNVEVYSDGEIEIDEVNAKTAYFENLTVCAESAALKGGKYKRISAATNEYITHCLAEGYAFCDESSTPKKWYGVNDNKESLENVTIKPVPIKAFTLTSDDERCILGKNAIITAELTLQDAASSCSYEWFDLTGGVLKTLPGTDSSITISAPALGKHTYECVVTVDGYKTMELIDITVEVCNHKNANGTVAFNEQTGICSLCDEKVVVSVANGSNIAYYTDIHTAISALKQGDALKLLQNVTDEGADGIKFDFSDNSMAVTVDLNGKKLTAQKLSIHNGVTMKNGDVVISGADGRFAIAPSARFTVEESGINVTGELQISVTSSEAVRLYGGSYTAINMVGTDIGKVLADDYGIRTEEGVWYTNTTGEQVTDVENVTVKKLPITAVSVTADKESYVYQDSGTLTATATLATGVTETPTYQWYRVYAGNEELMRKQTEQSYTFPSHTAGEFVYKCAVTVDGYSKVGELNLTVAPRTPVATEDFTIITGKVLTYNTKEQELVYTERNNVGTFHYRLGETGTWTTTYPKAKDADVVIYEIYWYLESTNSNYTDLGSEQNPQGPVYARINELDISKMDSIILSSEQTVDLTYTGAAQTPALSLSLKTKPEETVPSQLLEELTVGTDYALSNVTAQTEVGLYEATVTGRRNLKGETTVSWKISPAAAPTNAVATVEFYSNLQRSYSVDLSALLPTLDAGKSYGTLSGTIGTYSGSADITNVAVDQDNKLTFSVADSAFSTGTAGEAVINVRTQNYGNFDLTVKLNAKPRPIPTGNPALSKTEITYGESVGSVSFTSASMTGESGEEVRGTFAWKNGSATPNVTDSYSAAWEFTPEEGSVYDKASGTAQLKINPAALTNVSVTANELTYNGSEQTATVNKTATAVGQNSVTFTYSEDENGAYSENVPAFKNAGTYTVYYKASANNHVTADGSFTVKVNKRKISPIAVVENKVYDGTTDAVASIDFENLVKGESLTEEVDYSVTATFDNKNIGTRTAEVSVSLKETTVANNYELAISSVSESANISKKQLKITAATVSDKNYDGTTDATVTSVTFDGLVGNDSLVLGTDYTVDASFENKNVGENKKVTLRVITENTYATMNYSFVGQTFNNATATIIPSQAKAPAFNNKSAEYTGAAISHEPIEAPFTGVTAVSYTYVGIQGTVYESTSAAPTNSGVYIVTASFTMAEGYAQLSPATSTLIIRKASNTWIVEPSVSDWTYGESAKVTAGQSKFGTVKVSYKKQGEPDESYSDTVPTEAGEYNICFSVEGTDNYNDIILETSFEIKRKPVTGAVVGAFDSMTYSGDEQLPKAKVTLDNEPVTGDWSPVKNVSDKTNFTATGNFTGTISDKETSMAKATLKTSAENPTTAILRRGEALKYASIIEGDILGVGDMPVSGSFQWIDDEEVLNTSGKASVRFTEEKGNYEPLVFEIEVSTYSGGTGGGRRNDNIIVVVTENEDGSVTTTTTNKLTGTVTEETEWSDGSSLSTETRKNGNKTVIEKDTEGTVTEIKTDAKGNTTTTTKREDGVTVTTKETAEGEKTTEITVPKNKEAEITLPVSDADEIEKVIVTDKSGNKTEITDFEKSEGGHKH